ncbi:hypothetical protein DAHU10_040170 [Hanseniaspora uvarum]|nr:hypothetical protein DAHU10_040170 [Hanseniaspora uvarum]
MVYKISLVSAIPESYLDTVKESLLDATNINRTTNFFINYSSKHIIYRPVNLNMELAEEQQNRIRVLNDKHIIKYDIPMPGNNNTEVSIQNFNILDIALNQSENIDPFLNDLGYVKEYEYTEEGETLNVHEIKLTIKIFKINNELMEKGGYIIEIFSLLENFQDFDYNASIKKNLLSLKQKMNKHFPLMIMDRKLMDSRIQDY